jgi:hypothetical protein
VRDGARAAAKASSAGFDLTATLDVKGAQGSAASAFMNGPVTLHVKGHAGRLQGRRIGSFDLSFDVKASGLTMSGRALTPDGKTVYVQLPFALGPGWYETKLPQTSAGPMRHGYRGLLRGLRPRAWLSHVRLSHPDGSDRIDADLDVRRVLVDVAALARRAGAGHGLHLDRRDLRMLARVQRAVKTHGYVAYDPKTSLPEALGADISVDVKRVDPSADARSVRMTLRATFDDWNQPLHVQRPSGAKPLPHGGLFGGASPFGAAA